MLEKFKRKVKKKFNSFNKKQKEGLVKINHDIARIIFAGMVIQGVAQSQSNIKLFVVGIAMSIMVWYASHYINSYIK